MGLALACASLACVPSTVPARAEGGTTSTPLATAMDPWPYPYFDAAARDAFLAALDPQTRERAVVLKSRVLLPSRDPAIIEDPAARHLYVQFTRLPTAAEHERIASLGVDLLQFVANRTYVASCARGAVPALAADALVAGFAAILPPDKLSASLYADVYAGPVDGPPARYAVHLYADEAAETFVQALAARGIEAHALPAAPEPAVAARLTPAQLRETAALDPVAHIAPEPPGYELHDGGGGRSAQDAL